ncbi:MAG: ATP-binding cassette domain-containing protein, partial [Alphaproteobacteria bacterium]|nr:ATP-binding cassette domain-containing protein [Alphaproteobacteria bacterium]
MRGIEKSFGAIHANRNVTLEVASGTIHGIVGENGAGKSTLMSILYGFHEADAGEILIGGRRTEIRTPRDAIAAGIGMVHQHFMLVETLSVVENVMLGAEDAFVLRGGRARARAELERLSHDFGLSVHPDAIVGDLPVGELQRVEILKALYRQARILILDEPTGVLTPVETDQLFRILRLLREQGVTILLITHKLREIMEVTDSVSVMRGGEKVADRLTAATSREELAELMVGRKVRLELERTPARPRESVLAVRDLVVSDVLGVRRVDGVSFDLRGGEVVGIAGVSGNGQSELLETLAGIRPVSAGEIVVAGRRVDHAMPCDPAAMRRLGLAHVPE